MVYTNGCACRLRVEPPSNPSEYHLPPYIVVSPQDLPFSMGVETKAKAEAAASHVEGGHQDGVKDVVYSGREANEAEHAMTFKQAITIYRKAVMWSLLVSTSIIMEGYDIVLVTSLFAQPAFARDFGSYSPEAGYQIAGAWQSALGAAPQIGAIAGAFANGYLTHKFGYRPVLISSLASMMAFIFIIFFANSPAIILVGLLLCGVPWGVFATMGMAYASEVCPLALRGYLTVYINLCWALGQLIAAGVLEGFVNRTDEWAYRIPFAIQWAWPIPLLASLWFAPESPWWLVRKGDLAAAEQALRRLCQPSMVDVQQSLAMIIHTNAMEEQAQVGTSYLDCFRGVDLRRTEIACLTFAAQIWSGSPLGGTPAYFFTQAGLSSANAFKFSCGGLGIASIGTIIAWGLLSIYGRRTLYLWGLAVCCACMLIVGSISAGAGEGSASSYAQASFVLLWLFAYYVTIGSVCYPIISEISATRLRSKSVCLSRISYYVSQIIGNVVEPYLINPHEGNLHGKAGYFWAGTAAIFLVWAYFRLPETKDRTYEELDVLFNKRIGARQFSRVIVDAYALEEHEQVKQE